MKQIVTQGIVLRRINFQEADRIITVLTPDYGKIRLMAKGVRKQKSKLAGGIELFSISDITYLPPKKEIGTLVSSRLKAHYGNIVKDINRTMLGYELLKRIDRATEDGPEEEYFNLLEQTLIGLNDEAMEAGLLELWSVLHLLQMTGHGPNLKTDVEDKPLSVDTKYSFDTEAMAFSQHQGGTYDANHIKLLRLCLQTSKPSTLQQVNGAAGMTPALLQLVKTMLARYIRV